MDTITREIYFAQIIQRDNELEQSKSPDVSEQPVLSESEQTKTSEKSDLTTKEAREQMQIDQMEDDSADHPEE